jgi:hypothetical protein
VSRDAYYSFLKKNKIGDIFIPVTTIPYSKKLEIIKELVKSYDKEIIKKVLAHYESRWIHNNRIEPFYRILNTLKWLCKKEMGEKL